MYKSGSTEKCYVREGGFSVSQTEEIYPTIEDTNPKKDFLKKILDSLPHSFFFIDAKDYRIEMANLAARSSNFLNAENNFIEL